jgi:hypothetical protein
MAYAVFVHVAVWIAFNIAIWPVVALAATPFHG